MKTLITLLLLATIAVAAERSSQYVYKLSRLSKSEVGISCLNGGDPTGRKIGDVLIISCGGGQ